MKKIVLLVCLPALLICSISCNTRSGPPRVLVFTKTAGFRHSSIPAGQQAIIQLGKEHGFVVDTTEDASWFTEDSLKHYSAVIFLQSTGDLLNNYEEADFQRYIEAGGGYVGIHAASDAEYDWGWYGRLVGGYFDSHPKPQEAKLIVTDHDHPSTKHLPDTWTRTDEWYNFKNLDSSVHVLLKIDENSYEGGKNGSNHPMAWYHEYDGGRAWYTELGHTEASYSDSNYLKHILGGIEYAIGKNKKLDYSKATTLRVPEENRFVKTQLVQGTFFEPTEMTVLPNLDVLVAQRRGELLLYKNSEHAVKPAGLINVYWKTEHTPNVNAEEGLLGIKADPDFEKNHFVYVFYSPADTSVNRLSRFTFENDSLNMASEKIILQFYSQREICCHTGGSIAFGKDHELFVSAGDNSTPFDEPGQPYVSHGFGPLDDRPGHEQYDARRSAGNTNDLRGKIMRIIVNPDGSYAIPDGNLFPKGMAGTRPEIYVMGNRNPYRISVDPKTGYLYWGEVGPDASNDSLDTRGPRGYDELNQARKAGNFGWPLFVGNNYPYHAYDYATGKYGPAFDPMHPVNDSRNNTGLKDLPPVSPAFIWYPYGASKEFPQVGSGGRTAMAGPVFYSDLYPKETRLPDYYNGKLFFYDWIRNFIKVVTMRENGDFDKMEPFMEHTKLANVIDMEMGPDGRIYMLEYGSGWFQKNPDAGLSRIDYLPGNRPPAVGNIQIDKTNGAIPLTVHASVKAVDPENDPLSFTWKLSNGDSVITSQPEFSYTFSKSGDYDISVKVSDDKNAFGSAAPVALYAGNDAPEVDIKVMGNRSFYFPGHSVRYAVDIKDKEDGAGPPDPSHLIVTADYLEGSDRAAAPRGHQTMSALMEGKNLMESLDCKNCHQVDKKSIGPAFMEVAKRYKSDRNATNSLAEKIIKGGSGSWGEVAMAAHPTLRIDDAKLIVNWIRSLGTDRKDQSLPAAGSLPATMNKEVRDNGVLYISATYTDKGGPQIKPLTGNDMLALHNSKVLFSQVKHMKSVTVSGADGISLLLLPAGDGWFSIDSIDLSGIGSALLSARWQNVPEAAYHIECRLDAPNGMKLAEADIPGTASKAQANGSAQIKLTWPPVTDGKLHSLYIVSKSVNSNEPNRIALESLQFQLK